MGTFIDGYAEYPIPIGYWKSHNKKGLVTCVYEKEFYFNNGELINICKKNHFAQIGKLIEDLKNAEATGKKYSEMTCKECNEPLAIALHDKMVTLNKLVDKIK